MTYDVTNWYWQAEDGRLFSSQKSMLVKKTDKDFLDWKKNDTLPTPWPKDEEGNETDAALQWVFDNAGAHVYVSLDALKDALKQSIDDAAETERLRHITPGYGQSMTYQQKAAEALKFKSDPSPQDDSYPMLAAEIGITGDDLASVATVVLEAHNQWRVVGAAIETVRLTAKRGIDSAASADEARSVLGGIVWP